MTPLVRKLAAEHGVDLAGIKGTGVGGRIRKQDVLEAARSAQPEPAKAEQPEQPEQQPVGSSDGKPVQATSPVSSAPGPASPAAAETRPAPRVEPSPLRGKTEKMSRLRSVIARRMVESLQVSAQLTTVVEVDVTRVARLRQLAKADFERREGVKLSFLPFFAVAAVEALKQHPGVNASIDTEAGTITYHEAEHLGVAVDTDRGLLVPVIHDAGDLALLAARRARRHDVDSPPGAVILERDHLRLGGFELVQTTGSLSRRPRGRSLPGARLPREGSASAAKSRHDARPGWALHCAFMSTPSLVLDSVNNVTYFPLRGKPSLAESRGFFSRNVASRPAASAEAGRGLRRDACDNPSFGLPPASRLASRENPIRDTFAYFRNRALSNHSIRSHARRRRNPTRKHRKCRRGSAGTIGGHNHG